MSLDTLLSSVFLSSALVFLSLLKTLIEKLSPWTIVSLPSSTLRNRLRLDAVAQACNPSTLGGRGGWITRSRDRDHLGRHGETPSLLKTQKISWAWWRGPVIPATQEAEAGELPEPRRQRLRWAEIAPLHSSLGNKSETPSQKKNNVHLSQDKELLYSISWWQTCYLFLLCNNPWIDAFCHIHSTVYQ